MAASYQPAEIEAKWRARWEADRLYRVTEDSSKPKYYALTMYPYPSGDLHIGHWYAMAPSDAQARYLRMRGYNVLHPMGFDAFGLPAENAAINRGIHPFTWTMANIENMRRQLRAMGCVYDWDREIICCLPEYYRWNQWFFLKLLERGLAYRAKAPVNWCPKDNTVLANEQVLADGTCERCGTPVIKRDLEQWFFRITAYAEELLKFEGIEWPDRVATMQRNWIGRSQGVQMTFDAAGADGRTYPLEFFTTRPDTVFGATFMVLAPEHPLVENLTTPDRRTEVEAYVAQARRETEIERQAVDREKTGVFLGSHAFNRFSQERVPIYIADYVLMGYGTGAIMAVPAHDERDFAFATRFGLPIPVVIAPPDWDGQPLPEAYTGPGTLVNSGRFNGLTVDRAKEAIGEEVERLGIGKRTVTYRLRDWLISRQRYWGTPIPVVYCDTDGIVPVPEDQLPVVLPEDAEFRPTGESPLKLHDAFVNTTCPRCGRPAKRETDTMDTFVDSSWYFLRYTSPHFDEGPFEPAKARYWCPVDLYTGGIEHAILHLLYARFVTKAIRDLGLIDFGEPFVRLFNQGIILGEDNEKMSKSRGNVVAPDEFVKSHGADTVRTFLMFIGPWDEGGSWSSSGIQGPHRWLNRVRMLVEDTVGAPAPDRVDPAKRERLPRVMHRTIALATERIEQFKYNTTITALMELTNELHPGLRDLAGTPEWDEAMSVLVRLLAPIAPYLTEELWERMGRPDSVHTQPWPEYDPALLVEDSTELVVQVNGKVRDRLTLPRGVAEDEAVAQAQDLERVRSFVNGKQIVKVVYVPDRLINFVIR